MNGHCFAILLQQGVNRKIHQSGFARCGCAVNSDDMKLFYSAYYPVNKFRPGDGGWRSSWAHLACKLTVFFRWLLLTYRLSYQLLGSRRWGIPVTRHRMPAVTALLISLGYTWAVEIVSWIAWARKKRRTMDTPTAMADNGDCVVSLTHCEDEASRD